MRKRMLVGLAMGTLLVAAIAGVAAGQSSSPAAVPLEASVVPSTSPAVATAGAMLRATTGSETIVDVVQLHGGTPEPIWAADGSGFLYRFEDGSWGATPLDGGPVVRRTPTIFSSRFRLEPPSAGAMPELTDADTVGRQWLGDLLAPALPVSGTNAAAGDAVWMLLVEARGSRAQAVVAKLTGPGEIASIHRFAIPGPVVGLELSDDDTLVAFDLSWDGPPWPFVLARVGDGATMTATSPAIDGLRLGLLPAAEGEGWPGG